MRLLYVAGARPNFMKVASVMREGAKRGLEQILVHTGQHYDPQMSDVFFADLDLPVPDYALGAGSGTHAEQTARVLCGLEPILAQVRPDWVVVVGDVNSTLAAALVAAKLGLPLVHVEAGLRSFDRTMPEEVNRVVTDVLADLLLTPSADADENLRHEGRAPRAIRRVGNVMIDALDRHLEAARRRAVPARFALEPHGYAVVTLHRPVNVDEPAVLDRIMRILRGVAARVPVIFPVHPRTRERLGGMPVVPAALQLVDPLGYLDFLGLLDGAMLALTDSGGIQEETTALGIPCLTLRSSTERPVTVALGTNRVVGTDVDKIERSLDEILSGTWPRGIRPPLWDGNASERVVDALLDAEVEVQPEIRASD